MFSTSRKKTGASGAEKRGKGKRIGHAFAEVAVAATLACCLLFSCGRRVAKIEANPSAGFEYPYYLYVPWRVERSSILVIPNNSGFVSDDFARHDEGARRDVASFGRLLAEKLHCVLLVPVFPRAETTGYIYTHALDRDTLMMEGTRLDVQLINMMNDARSSPRLAKRNLDERAFMFGFSASGMFVNRFALLHPSLVKAVSCGSPGGWPIAPLAEYEGRALTYPVGIADVPELVGQTVDTDSWKAIPQFYFIGSNDANDSVPYDDGYDPSQKDLVFGLFGENLIERFAVSEKIYRKLFDDVRFTVYQGVGHTITDDMIEDTIKFFDEVDGRDR